MMIQYFQAYLRINMPVRAAQRDRVESHRVPEVSNVLREVRQMGLQRVDCSGRRKLYDDVYMRTAPPVSPLRAL